MQDKLQINDTIAAIATPFGLAGVGIIRISGPLANEIGKKLFIPKQNIKNLKSHHLYLGKLVEPSSGNMIDEVLLSYMKEPHSYTREDIIEINSHSGHILLTKILDLILNEGARLAKPGEFTFRAYSNGRIDLTQAEAIVDIVNAQSEKGLQLASRQITGDFKNEIETLRGKALDILAHVEVAIDFPEEKEGIIPKEDTAARIEKELVKPVDHIVAAHRRRKIWMDGINTVIAGRVNVGKSSLLNCLLNEQKALVTSIPGTTRDVIESTVHIHGIPLKLMDTAGIRKISGEVEKLGMDLTEKKLSEADLALIVIDQSRSLNQDDLKMIARAKEMLSIIILNKKDLPKKLKEKELHRHLGDIPSIEISALTGEGIENLSNTIKDRILGSKPEAIAPSLVPNLRHKTILEEASKHFHRAARNTQEDSPMEIIADDLKNGLDALGEIIGETFTEEIYDRIFNDFCLGK